MPNKFFSDENAIINSLLLTIRICLKTWFSYNDKVIYLYRIHIIFISLNVNAYIYSKYLTEKNIFQQYNNFNIYIGSWYVANQKLISHTSWSYIDIKNNL